MLYEMLTGRAAYSGNDVTDILAAVIRAEPEWKNLPANLHGRLREVLERCLKKDPRERYRDISDVKADIQRVLTDPGGVLQPIAGVQSRSKVRAMVPWIAAALGVIVGMVAVWSLKKPEPRQVMRFTYDLPEGRQFSDLTYPALAISPDGKQIVYTTEQGLYLRSVDELTDKLIVGSEGSTSQPFFSPDGKWIGYFSVADVKLKKISINGGAAITVCDCTPYGASWDTENTIVYGQLAGDVMRVSANGGKPVSLVKGKAELHWAPQMLPDGKSVLYTGSRGINMQSVRSGESKGLFPGFKARYLQTGHIVYFSPEGNSIFAVPFDLDQLEVKGGQVPIVEGIVDFAVSDSGTLVYIPGQPSASRTGQRTLVWVDRKGKEVPIAAQPNSFEDLHISPDGTKVALEIQAGDKNDIWIWDLLRETMSRLTFDGASYCPLWTADGKRVAFGSDRENKAGIYWKAADGTGGEAKLGSVTDQAYMIPWSWSGDGKTLVTIEGTDTANRNIGAISMEGDRKWRPLLHEKYYENVPQISPDGRYMAYCSNESGSMEVYVRPFPDINAGKWQVSGKGAEFPVWAPDGKALFYQTSDAMMAVPVETQPTFKAGKPEPLFRGTYAHWTDYDGHPWDIHPDGKRFLMMKPVQSAGKEPAAGIPRQINIVLNWTEELKQRVPAK